MARCLYVVLRTAVWNLIVPRRAVDARPLHHPGGHKSYKPTPTSRCPWH